MQISSPHYTSEHEQFLAPLIALCSTIPLSACWAIEAYKKCLNQEGDAILEDSAALQFALQMIADGDLSVIEVCTSIIREPSTSAWLSSAFESAIADCRRGRVLHALEASKAPHQSLTDRLHWISSQRA